MARLRVLDRVLTNLRVREADQGVPAEHGAGLRSETDEKQGVPVRIHHHDLAGRVVRRRVGERRGDLINRGVAGEGGSSLESQEWGDEALKRRPVCC
jgi:hypothetical protein